jgi:hypothetical protein
VAFLLRKIFPKTREILYQIDSNQGNISSIIGKTFLQLNYSLMVREKYYSLTVGKNFLINSETFL